jgi:hypothetical protein
VSASRPSYIGEPPPRQSQPFPRSIALAISLAALLAGCAGMGLPGPADTMTTGSIPTGRSQVVASVSTGVDPSDWETVREALSGMAGAGGGQRDIPWRNPVTGSAGTITAYAAEEKGPDLCRSFATTLSDMRGVRRYRGEACERAGTWRLTGVAPEDSKLL